MAIELPAEQKVYTTTYSDFRGVDYTNDPTNVWRRRSPSGVNMLPDASGRPFKRYGWKIHIPKETLANKYALDTGEEAPSEVSINKMYYFTLNGIDHIFIFANIGVFIYRKKYTYDAETEEQTITEELATAKTSPHDYSYQQDVIDSYNRAYFFEGNGTSAFYIYGNFQVWRYRYDDVNDGFVFEKVEPYIPTVNIGVDARHETGTSNEGVNLFGNYIAETFQNNVYSDGVYKIQLPISFNTADGISVYVSVSSQFDTPIQVITSGTPTSSQAKLYHDTLTFGAEYSSIIDGEDSIKIIYPRKSATKTTHTTMTATVTVKAG